jgi:uncharacterized protein (TIGR02594 family)
MRTLLLALTFVGAICSDAEARPHRGHHATARRHAFYTVHRHIPTSTVAGDTWNLGNFGRNLLVAEARSQIGNGAIYGRATLWCARFVNYLLKATGHSGTGSDQAASFSHYGTRVRGPQVGAIAVMARRGGGHVGVVSAVADNGDPVIISGNHGHRVREAVYPKGRVYAYVLPR